MKSDREFLNGVYHKIEELNQVEPKRQAFLFTRKIKGVMAVVVLTFVFVPSFYFSTLPTMKRPTETNNIAPRVASTRNLVDIREVIEQADVVVRGKVSDIGKSVYEEHNITTTVELTPKEVYKGTLEGKTIKLIVNGGFDKETRAFFEYEAIFKRNEDTLLFLNKINDSYILTHSSQGKYTYLKTMGKDRIYKASDGETLSLLELKKIIERGENNEN